MKHFCFLFCVAILFSCEKDNEPAPSEMIDNGGISTVSGEWHLQSIIAFNPDQAEFALGEYVWTISDALDSVFVVQAFENVIPFAPLPGDITYSLVVTEDSLLTNLYDYGYHFQDSILLVTDHPEVDGPIYRFIRPE